MKNNQLTTRWRALHNWIKETIRRLKKLLVNPITWKLAIAVFRFIIWVVRLLQEFMQ
jgi:hypothetical protein